MTRAVIAVVSSILGLSILSVILSQRAQTSSVLGSAGQALASVIGAATSPVTGGGGGVAAAATNAAFSGLIPALGNGIVNV